MGFAKVDSKGRLLLPREIHEMLGDVVELKLVGKKSVLLERARNPISKKNETVDFAKLLDRDPRRTGKPENPNPDEMKSIWNE